MLTCIEEFGVFPEGGIRFLHLFHSGMDGLSVLRILPGMGSQEQAELGHDAERVHNRLVHWLGLLVQNAPGNERRWKISNNSFSQVGYCCHGFGEPAIGRELRCVFPVILLAGRNSFQERLLAPQILEPYIKTSSTVP